MLEAALRGARHSMNGVHENGLPNAGLVVEDLDHVRRGLSSVLTQAFPGIAMSEAGDLRSARALLAKPEGYRIALVDLGLPDGSGVDLIRELRSLHPSTLVIVTTIFDDDEHVFAAIAAGADGYLLKDHRRELLVERLRLLEQGVPALSPEVARRMLGYFRQNDPFARPPDTGVRRILPAEGSWETQLTARETEVLSLIGRGLQRGEVAALLAITENTVAKYLKEIYRKLNISSRAEAALEARRRGLV
jgi:DNA-binding NarL/FixJ family response regulator